MPVVNGREGDGGYEGQHTAMSAPLTQFGRYEILGTLGQGSFATVYRARDPLLERTVALKVLLPHLAADAEDRQRFLAEARALAALRHPGIVTVYEAGESEGQPFIAMELVEGETLAARAARSGPLPLIRVLPIIISLAAALDVVHAAGLVHRDVKDSNVLIEPSGRVVLMDFGIALATSRARLTQVGYGMGTPESASPEQIRGDQVGPAADSYALGVLTYQLLAGRLPFSGDIAHVLYAQAHLPPPPLREARPGLPAAVYAAVEAALAKDPADRPESAGAFARMLAGQDAVAVPQTAPQEGLGANVEGRALASQTALSDGYLVKGTDSAESAPLQLNAGFTMVHVLHDAEAGSRFSAELADAEGRTLAILMGVRGGYTGTRALVLTAAGAYTLRVKAQGTWSVNILQPDPQHWPAASAAHGVGDDVTYLALKAGVHTFSINYRVWTGSPLRVALHDREGTPLTVLVVAQGSFVGTADRRIAESGVYPLVVEAEGSWSVTVV